MQTRSCQTSDGLTLDYCRAGEGGEVVFCVNAPGLSLQFWSSVIQELQGEHTVIAFNYRRVPGGERKLTDEDLQWGRLVEDVSLILRQESVSVAHFASWGLGTKLALAFCQRFPDATRSLTAFGVSDTSLEAHKKDAYADAVSAVSQSLTACPESVELITAILKRVGGYAGPNLLASALSAGEEAGAVLRLVDLLEMESPMANLAFDGLDTPAGLLNYLKIQEVFLRAGVSNQVQSLNIPIRVVEAAEDGLASLSAENREQLSAIPGLEFQTISPATHFVLLERPLKCAHIIAGFVRQQKAEKEEGRTTGDVAAPQNVSPSLSYA